MSIKKSNRKPILNQLEFESNKSVFDVYNLIREDFSTEAEYNDFLDERESLIYNLVHNQNTEQAKATSKAFYKNNSMKIDKRKAQQMDEVKNSQHINTLPLRAQIKYQVKSRQLNLTRKSKARYSNAQFLSDIQAREENWKPKQDISIGEAGGLPDQVYFDKCKQELDTSLFLPKAFRLK